MYVVDEGKSKVVEIGVYILETLGSVGLPADQVTQVLLRYTNLPHPRKGKLSSSNADENTGSSNKKKKKSSSTSSKRRRRRSREALLAEAKSRESRFLRQAQEDARRRKLGMTTRSQSGGNDLFQRAMRFVVEARNSSPQQIISKILFYLADALGESLDDPSKRDLERAVDAFMEEAHFHRGRGVKLGHIPPHLGKSVTGVVLSYRERDDLALPAAVLNRIRRGMHFEIPVRPFDATVQLLPPPQVRRRNVAAYAASNKAPLSIMDQEHSNTESLLESNPALAHKFNAYARRRRSSKNPTCEARPEEDNDDDEEHDLFFSGTDDEQLQEFLERQRHMLQHVEENDYVSRLMACRISANSAVAKSAVPETECVVPCSPKSFPATPDSRSAVLDYSLAFTENVLWRARDELRGEQIADDRPRMAIFNQEDAHPKIILSCGGHCASLDYFIGVRRASFQKSPTRETQQQKEMVEEGAAAATASAKKTEDGSKSQTLSGTTNAKSNVKQTKPSTVIAVAPNENSNAMDVSTSVAAVQTNKADGKLSNAAQEPGQQPKQQRDAPRAPLAQRIYRSVRAALALPYGRTTYFEMCPVWAGEESLDLSDVPLHVCVGLSTRNMALRNTVPGCSANTVGLDSSGVLLVSGHRTRTAMKFTYGSVVGVCVRAWISHLLVAFYVDGKQVACHAQELGLQPGNDVVGGWLQAFPIRNISGNEPASFYPTVSLKSRNVKVFAHFSAADMRHSNLASPYWSAISRFVPGEPIYALDGTLLCGDHYQRGQSTAE